MKSVLLLPALLLPWSMQTPIAEAADPVQPEMDPVQVEIETPTDSIPDFAANPTIVSVASGDWSSPSTWSPARVPGSGDVVRIDAAHTVDLDVADTAVLAALGIDGTLRFDRDGDRTLTAGTILVYRDGRLEIGTEADPFPDRYAAEIVVADRPLATTAPDPDTGVVDPMQFGTGLIALGEVEMYGSAIPKTWFRSANELRAGQDTLTFDSPPTGWRVGDKLVITDTRQLALERGWSRVPPKPAPMQIDEVEVAAISGNQVTLTQPLAYDHLAGRDSDGQIIGLPHVANLSRNVVVRSANPEGTRGHVMFTERAEVDVAYAEFVDLGRTTAGPLDNTTIVDGVVTHIGTNQVARYSVHMHRLMGPENPTNTGYQFEFVGSSIHRGERFGIVLHDAHFGKVDNNVIYDMAGSSLMTEMGNERENEITNNIAVLSGTPYKNNVQPTYGGVTGPNRPLRFRDFGYEGSGFWFTGLDNIDTGNVAANMAFAGFNYNGRPFGFAYPDPRVPKVRGANIADPSQWTKYRNGEGPSIRMSKNNEVYASAEGLWVGFFRTVGTISDYRIWHISQEGLYSRRNESAHYERVYLYNDPAVSNASWRNSFSAGITLNSARYQDGYQTFRDFVVEGFILGIDLAPFKLPMNSTLPRETRFDNGELRNFVNVRDHTPVGGSKFNTLRDVTFATNPGPENMNFPGAPRNISVKREGSFSISTLLAESRLYIENYNKQPGVDLEFFHRNQAPDYVMDVWTGGYAKPSDMCPTLGMTNQECRDTYGVSTMGAIATCTDDSDPLFDGFLCPNGPRPK
ncbi:MAG: G8 domain-containing protein [Microthrixaceae bacterium]